MAKKKKWYETNWFIILMLIFIFPAGLALMWVSSKWNVVVKILVTIFIAILLFIGMVDIAKSTVQPPEQTRQQPAMTADEIEHFNTYVGAIQGSVFVKEATVSGNVATITYSTYDEFKALNPDSTISEEDYSIYWGLNDAINKVLMEEPIRILREIPGLQQVNMKIPFEGKIHKVQLDRNAIEKYLNVDLEEIHNDTSLDLWREKIAKKFFNKEERAKFVEKFVTVS